jgi:hypothetical protein
VPIVTGERGIGAGPTGAAVHGAEQLASPAGALASAGAGARTAADASAKLRVAAG